MVKITNSNQVFSCYSSHKKINWESILIKPTYTDINLNNSMVSYVSCFYLTYRMTHT